MTKNAFDKIAAGLTDMLVAAQQQNAGADLVLAAAVRIACDKEAPCNYLPPCAESDHLCRCIRYAKAALLVSADADITGEFDMKATLTREEITERQPLSTGCAGNPAGRKSP